MIATVVVAVVGILATATVGLAGILFTWKNTTRQLDHQREEERLKDARALRNARIERFRSAYEPVHRAWLADVRSAAVAHARDASLLEALRGVAAMLIIEPDYYRAGSEAAAVERCAVEALKVCPPVDNSVPAFPDELAGALANLARAMADHIAALERSV